MSIKNILQLLLLGTFGVLGSIPGGAAQNNPRIASLSVIDEQVATRTFAVTFPEAVLTARENGLQELTMGDLPRTKVVGAPQIPFQEIRLALPPGTTVEGNLLPIEAEEFRRPLAAYAPMLPSAVSARLDESPVWVDVQLRVLHDQPIAVIRVFGATATSGNHVTSLKSGHLILTLTRDKQVPTIRALRNHQWRDVAKFVNNPQDLPSDPVHFAPSADGDYDYLIVTNSQLAQFEGQNDLATFRVALENAGLRTQVILVDDIARDGDGSDLPQRIRNAIRAEYLAHGIRYVLLLGDGDDQGAGAIIPARTLWSKIRGYNGQWMDIERQIPSDFYYSCLDGDFNGDGDDRWGEPNDGANGSDVDMLAEVTVGRLSVDTPAELQTVVRKSLAYRNRVQPKRVLLMGELLFQELDSWGKTYMEQLVGESTDHGYTTQGYSPQWTIERMYDKDKKWTGNQALAKINTGNYAMVNHLGHSNTTYNMRLSTSWGTPNFTNPNPFFFYTQGCYPGAFNANESFIEKLLRHENAFAGAIANSVFGLGPEDPDPSRTATPGASHMLHRQFIDALFSEGITALGEAHQDSKNDNMAYTGAQEMRWVFWSTNFFGDPSLPLQL